MKDTRILIWLTLFGLLLPRQLQAQLLFEENFKYAVADTFSAQGPWLVGNSSGSLKPAIVAGNLAVSANYAGSNAIGAKMRLNTVGYDLTAPLASVDTSKTIYYAVLMKVDSAQQLGDYFIGLTPKGATNNMRARIVVRDTLNKYQIGFAKASTFIHWDPVLYEYKTTQLVVMSLQYIPGPQNDICKSFVNPPMKFKEPLPTWTCYGGDSLSIDIVVDGIGIRQGRATDAPMVEIDGIRVAQTWVDVIGYSGGFDLADLNSPLNMHPGVSNAAGIADINNDGIPDVVLLSNEATRAHKLFHGMGAGKFHYDTASVISKDLYPATSLAFGDYDNDGWIDLYLSNASANSPNYLYRNVKGKFEPVFSAVPCLDSAGTGSPSWADYNNDGYLDLFVPNVNGPNFLYKNNGNGTFTKDLNSAVQKDTLASYQGAFVDYDNDGWLDLVVANKALGTALASLSFYKNHQGVFGKVIPDSLGTIGTYSAGQAETMSWGDFNNDGYLDVFVGMGAYGYAGELPNSRLYINKGNGKFEEMLQTPITEITTRVHSSNWLDYDNDGNLDLYVTIGKGSTSSSYITKLFKGDGKGKLVAIEDPSVFAGVRVEGVCVGDLNLDGQVDLLLGSNSTNNNTRYYVGQASGNNWFGLNLKPATKNHSAIGAKVICHTDSGTITRVIQPNNGAFASHSPVLTIGLGSLVNNHTTIIWPSGLVEHVGNVPTGYYFTVNESGFSMADSKHPLMNHPGVSKGAGMADVNNDGKVDVVLLSESAAEPHRLWLGTEADTFRLNMVSLIRDTIPGGSLAFADYNNDGWVDLYISTNTRGVNYLFKNNNGYLAPEFQAIPCLDTAQTGTPVWGDYNKDGYLDLFVPNILGNNFLYTNKGDGTFEKDTTSDVVKEVLNSFVATWVDYDNDGWLDLVVGNSYSSGALQPVSVFRNHRGILRKMPADSTGELGKYTVGQAYSLSWGDYNNDGYMDVFVGMQAGGYAGEVKTSRLFRNDKNGKFTMVTETILDSVNLVVQGASWLDYDNDGHLDLYVSVGTSSSNSYTRLYKNDGQGGFSMVNTVANTRGKRSAGVTIGDLDQNGYPEILLGASAAAVNTSYLKNEINPNNWIGFELKPSNKNYTALGAKIICKMADKTVTRVVGQNSGSWSSSSTQVIIGMGTAEDEEITIEWPSGYVQKIGNPVINQYYTIHESELFELYDPMSDLMTVNESNSGIGMADVNNDGHMDIFMAFYGNDRPNRLYINQGNGSFVRDTNSVIVKDRNPSIACAFGDYDNDGWIDLYLVNTGGLAGEGNQLYRNNRGVYERAFNTAVCKFSDPTISATWADYNNDGYLDLFVPVFGDERNRLFINDTRGDFYADTVSDVDKEALPSYQGVWADFNNDGWIDLYVINNYATGLPCKPNSLFMNDKGVLRKETDPIVGDLISYTNAFAQSVSVGDYDNDGDVDIFVGSHVFSQIPDKKSRLYRNNGDGTFTTVTNTPLTQTEVAILGSNWVDYDNDGNLDLMLAVNTGRIATSRNLLFKGDGNGGFERINHATLVQMEHRATGLSLGDVNNDGFVDALMGNGASSRSSILYVNMANQNHWLGLHLVGDTSNQQAIGAKAVLYVNGKAIYREVRPQNGLYASSTPWLTFGLAQATRFDSVVITWPLGGVQVIRDLGIDRYHTITEPKFSSGTSKRPELKSHTSVEIYPNPASDRITIRLQTANSRPDPAVVYVRNLTGQTLVVFNGHANMDQHFDISYLKPGIYLVEIVCQGQSYVNKVIVR